MKYETKIYNECKKINDEVFFVVEPFAKVNHQNISFLKCHAAASPKKRARLCCHLNEKDKLHEMLIIHLAGAYIRPHKHLYNSVSFHVIDGLADIIIFDDVGTVIDMICMGNHNTDNTYYYRLSKPFYYTQVIRSDFFLFHETTAGPFNPNDTIWAPWAPAEDSPSKHSYLEKLECEIENYTSKYTGEIF